MAQLPFDRLLSPIYLLKMLLVVLAVVACVATCEVTGQEAAIVAVTQGRISGITETSTKGSSFSSYYGIPFAKPPLEDLRFKDPVPAESWDGVMNGSTLPNPCLQMSFDDTVAGKLASKENQIGKEDCLYLNVFTHKPNEPSANQPVMVWIHGGGFFAGGSHEYLPYVLLNHDIVLVVIQYRLGLLGFLSTEDSVMPGNYGLKDQILALQWVQENVHNFGGDASRVTIFGESAGGASVHYLILSPKSDGLFSRVIMQSGTAIVPWARGDKFREAALKAGKALGCPPGLSSEDLMICLQKGDASKLTAVFQTLHEWFILPNLMTPRVDGDYIPAEPSQLMKEGHHKAVDLMAGVVANEGALFSHAMYAQQEPLRKLMENFDAFSPVSLQAHEDDQDVLSMAKAIYEYYVGGYDFGENNSDKFTELLSDRHFKTDHDLVTQLHARAAKGHKKTFRYELEYRGGRSLGDYYDTEVGKHWVAHADDLFYLFTAGPLFGSPDLQSEEDLKLRDIMTSLWTNFAAFGNPTPDNSLGFTWEPSSEDDLHYLSLTPQPAMKDDTRKEARALHASFPTAINLILNPELVKSQKPAEGKEEL